MPKMTPTERAIFAACYAIARDRRSSADNSASEEALEAALWELECFRQALKDAGPR